MTAAQRREYRITEISRLKAELNALRSEMLQHVADWKYEQMQAAMERARSINKELDKLLNQWQEKAS